MFTGLIQSLGKIYYAGETQLRVDCTGHQGDRIYRNMDLGDSIAVDGVCLTVEQCLEQGFMASVSPETLRRTTLGTLEEGSLVNLEPSLRVGSKIGGHFVTGHIDGQGMLEGMVETANAWELHFTVPDAQVARYIVPKGSIAVNGISLTVAHCSARGDRFTVAVIPVTYAETNLKVLAPGSRVNLEGDILGKYVEKLLQVRSGLAPTHLDPSLDPSQLTSDHNSPLVSETLSLEFLAEHGYL